MKYLVDNCFRGNDFANHKQFSTNKFFDQHFSGLLVSKKRFSDKKILDQNFFRSKFLVDNYTRGKDFATKKFSTKNFFDQFLVDNSSRGNDFETKKFSNKIFSSNIFSGELFSRK